MALLYGGGVRGAALDAIQAWKEIAARHRARSRSRSRAVRARRLPFRPALVDRLALAFAAVVVLYALIPQSALDGAAGRRRSPTGSATTSSSSPPTSSAARCRSTCGGRAGCRRRGGGGRGVGARRGVPRPDRVVAPLGRGRLLPPRARLRLPRPGRAAGELRLQHERRPLPPARLDVRLAARDRVHARRRLLLLATVRRRRAARRRARGRSAPPACCWTFSRSSLVALAVGLVVLAPPGAAGGPPARRRSPSPSGSGSPPIFHDVAPRTHWFKSDLPYQEAQAKAKGPLPPGSGSAGHDQPRRAVDQEPPRRACATGSRPSCATRRATGSATRARPRSASA